MKSALLTIVILVVLIAGGAFLFLKNSANGFSTHAEPTAIETYLAHTARDLAMPASAKSLRNPQPNTPEVLDAAREHWADHCATCHANNGSGDTEMGRNLYPKAPDMRKAGTQNLTDGELFYIIENGVRLTGMPGWGGSGSHEDDSWKLVRFIRHLPQVTPGEERRMQSMNPKTPADLAEEKEEEEFLKGNTTSGNNPSEDPHAHHHH